MSPGSQAEKLGQWVPGQPSGTCISLGKRWVPRTCASSGRTALSKDASREDPRKPAGNQANDLLTFVELHHIHTRSASRQRIPEPIGSEHFGLTNLGNESNDRGLDFMRIGVPALRHTNCRHTQPTAAAAVRRFWQSE